MSPEIPSEPQQVVPVPRLPVRAKPPRMYAPKTMFDSILLAPVSPATSEQLTAKLGAGLACSAKQSKKSRLVWTGQRLSWA